MATDSVANATQQAAPALGGVWEVALGLALVIAAILVLAWALRRMAPGVTGGSGNLRIVAALQVGPRERLLVVDAAGQQLLLGVTTQGIRRLHTFTEPFVSPRPPAAGGDFAARLREVLTSGVRS